MMGGVGSGTYAHWYSSAHIRGMYSVLDPEFDAFDASDIELIQHVRETGEVLHADTLGNEGRPIGGWYNPGVTQRKQREWERRGAEEQEARRLVRIEQQREYRARCREQDERVEAEQRAIELKQQRLDDLAHERQNMDARNREYMERRCWDIAQEAAAHWQCSEIETRLMWNMLRYMNLGAGRGKRWNEGAFAAAVMVPDEFVRHCYKMLRDRGHG